MKNIFGMDSGMDGGMDSGMDGGMDGGMDSGMDSGMDGGMDGGWTLGGRWVDGTNNFGTGWSRKVDGMVTESGRDGHGKWSKTKDSL